MKKTNRKPTPVRDAHARRMYFDEVLFYLGVRLIDGKPPKREWEGITEGRDLEVNHIWSFGRRPDEVCNLIALTQTAHLWFHRHLTVGRVLCLLVKFLKHEENIPVWNHISGKPDIASWVESLSFTGPDEWAEKYRLRLLLEFDRYYLDKVMEAA